MKLDLQLKRIYRYLTCPLFFDKNNSTNILICGSGRSGTTWVEELVNYKAFYRVIFEPLHPTRGLKFRKIKPWHFIEDTLTDPEIELDFDKLFYGFYRKNWLDTWNLKRFRIYHGRIYKIIRGQGYLGYIKRNYPNLKLVYVMRHPLACLSSYYFRKWPNKLDIFLGQNNLSAGILSDHLDYICSIKSTSGKIVLRWCIENLMAFSQPILRDTKVIFYENMLSNPRQEIKKLEAYLGYKFDSAIDEKFTKAAVHTGKQFSSKNNIKQLKKWKSQLSEEQIDEAFEIISHFGFDEIYDLGFMPKKSNMAEITQIFTRV